MPTSRSAAVYADFLLPHLHNDLHLVDVGCGSGELSLELAPLVRRLTGVDDDADELARARADAEKAGVDCDFEVGDAYALPLPDAEADVVLGHSILEALERPTDALAEMQRVLKPNGLVAVASVEYGGLILHGPHESLIRRFFDIREQLWLAEGAFPYRGRELRGLLTTAGFGRVEASARYISYGTPDAVEEFGRGRADDCTDDWFVEASHREQLGTSSDLGALREAWLDWSTSAASYAAFAWCRALGWKV